MHPTGPYKSETFGTWAQVIDAMPYVVMPSQPFPPLAAIMKKLAEGMDHAGMSGGVEFPPRQLSQEDYQQIRADPIWASRGIANADDPNGT